MPHTITAAGHFIDRTFCTACGACEEACPQSIPLTKYFKGTSERLQGVFSYMSGRSFDEEIPYITFLEDELKDAED